MSESCNQECGSCSETCEDRTEEKVDFSIKLNEFSKVDKVYGVISGKGGVGKSMVTSMLATLMQRRGYHSAILDADITGPSIPKAFGITEKAQQNDNGIIPAKSKTGIDIMSINLLLDDVTDPVVWRGPIIANTVKQFYSDVFWDKVDYMFVDMPPGTGDVPLTVFQSIPLDGIIIVTTPQELVSMIVTKAVKMAEMMHVPIVGIVENMSYFKCDDCNKIHKIYGESNVDAVAKKHNIQTVVKLPIDPRFARACDAGMIELFDSAELNSLIGCFEEKGENMKIAVASDDGMVTQHFGHCKAFSIYEIENNKIVKSEDIPNPGHKPGFLPNFLNDLGVKVIVSGGMGGGAIDIFNEKNIEVVIGTEGTAQNAAELYLKGELKSTGSVCNHDHES